MNKASLVFLLGCTTTIPLAKAQNAAPGVTPFRVETSVSLGLGAQLTATRVKPPPVSAGAQSLDPSATVLGSVRQSVKPWLGYSLNLGYTRTTQESFSADTAGRGVRAAVPSNVYEVSVAYLVQKHFAPNVTGFANLGGGLLSFLPLRSPGSTTLLAGQQLGLAQTYQGRPLGVAAAGIDFRLRPRLMLRAEYRGLLYKFPDHDNTFGRATTETSQPTLSLVYRFGAKP